MEFVPCNRCRLRRLPIFRQCGESELAFMRALKSDQVEQPAGSEIAKAGEVIGRPYTLFRGWAFRYKRQPDGRRQIVDLLLPGDMIGLEMPLGRPLGSSVQALTDVSLCALAGRPLRELFERHPGLAEALVRGLIEDRQRGDDWLAGLSRRTARERLAYFLIETFDRAKARGLVKAGAGTRQQCPFPVRRRHLADVLAVSGTHVHRALVELREENLAAVSRDGLALLDRDRLAALAGYQGTAEGVGQRALL